jgi:hypothetical protein
VDVPTIRRATGGEQAPLSGLFGFGGGTRNDEVVVDAKDPGSGVGLHAGNRRALVVDDAVEGNVSISHDNVNGMEASRRIICDATGHQCDAATTRSHRSREIALIGVVFPQAGLRIDAVVDGSADTIVVRRSREDFDLVVDRVDSFNALENVGGAALESRTRGEAFENDGFAMEPKVIQSKTLWLVRLPSFFCTSLAMRTVSSCDQVGAGVWAMTVGAARLIMRAAASAGNVRRVRGDRTFIG